MCIQELTSPKERPGSALGHWEGMCRPLKHPSWYILCLPGGSGHQTVYLPGVLAWASGRGHRLKGGVWWTPVKPWTLDPWVKALSTVTAQSNQEGLVPQGKPWPPDSAPCLFPKQTVTCILPCNRLWVWQLSELCESFQKMTDVGGGPAVGVRGGDSPVEDGVSG